MASHRRRLKLLKLYDMQIPLEILTKTNKFQGKTKRIIEEGWNYLQNYFRDEDDYYNFLKNLSRDKFEQFLYAIFFYWAHDLYRIIKKEVEHSNIDGFMYQITLSIVEYLQKDISNGSKKRIKDFFTEYLSNSKKAELNDKIIARFSNDIPTTSLEGWEILYDMRNKFVHEAGWFIMKSDGAFASFGLIKRKNGIKYYNLIKIQYKEYLKIFWEAYLKYFGRKFDN